MTVQEYNERKAQSYKLLLWFAMISMVMMFAGLTSAYVVSTSRKDWLKELIMPNSFIVSTIILLLSSISFHIAKKSIKKDNRSKTSFFLIITLILGLVFVYFQVNGFKQFIDMGYNLTGPTSNVMVSFIYIVAFVHFLHLFGGIIALLIVIYNHYKQKYNSTQTLGIELAAMFWHFLDFLWILLFLFFYFYE
ncbi:cytochrome c oxidase subunit 3 [Flavobacterium filum]|uniref:cytochrome c oxidase subunit 3 n=1 Tax=Flavobacterium TaxID=237 RepID=UPI0023EFD771|nr:cytochrome c oxidase subunit 3 [Flavobacterium filum]